ncbi:MAG: hypothetical protein OEO23_16205, partial [Gemmatimonadota bacterium]|nr:hypothetical protein [Gemmatimonadota bacterium]
DSAPTAFRIRDIQSEEELDAFVEMQKDTWGRTFSDIVPSSMLQISAKMGGVVAGAFDEHDVLMGLVYGITGLRGGSLAHWSHMLAVRPEARNRGVGRALKLYQKQQLLTAGVKVMYWTFDPLVSRNAHLNLNRLGAEVDEYVPDMYGQSDSELHRLGTDRFIVRWALDAPVPSGTRAEGLDASVPRLLPRAPSGEATWPDRDTVAVGIPPDIEAVEADAFETALAWRTHTRSAFLHYLGQGHRVTGFVPGGDHGFYVLSARPTSEEPT